MLALFDDDSRQLTLPEPNGDLIAWQDPDEGPSVPDPDPGEPDPPDPTPDKAFIWPFDPRRKGKGGTVTREWMEYPGHRGIDMAPGFGKAIRAIGDGVVSYRLTGGGYNRGWGNYLRINHGNVDGVKIESGYAHMRFNPIPTIGANVEKGQIIGYVGYTGEVRPPNVNGSHLHMEIWRRGVRINPRPWMERHV